MLKDVTKVTVYVNDQDRALDYYTNVLGFEKRADAPFEEGKRWIEVGIPGSKIDVLLIYGYGGWEPERVGKSTGILLGADDVRQTIEELRGRGVKITMEPQSFDWGTNACFEDMDGNSYVLGGP
jgi:predicted enzyme related to lactoylglutathione lyase